MEELKERNICRIKSEKQEKEERELIKKELSRRLSQRPNVEVLKKKKILKFEEYVDVYEVPNGYDRKADKPWTKLTPEDKASIRKELNEYKVNLFFNRYFFAETNLKLKVFITSIYTRFYHSK